MKQQIYTKRGLLLTRRLMSHIQIRIALTFLLCILGVFTVAAQSSTLKTALSANTSTEPMAVIVVIEKPQPIVGVQSSLMKSASRARAAVATPVSETPTRIIDSLGKELTLHTEYSIINGFSGTITANGIAELEKLKKSGTRLTIYPDTVFYLQAIRDPRPILALNVSTNAIRANEARNTYNVSGRNITVAVIDSGIDYTHPALGNCTMMGSNCRVRDGYNFVNNTATPIDDNGHGTHVAGIIGANDSTTSFIGIAPDVNFYALKVCNAAGECATSAMINALQWAIDHNADVISMSIGASYSYDPLGNSGLDVISRAVNAAIAAGIPVVIAAGNDGLGIGTIAVPAAARDVITVGGIDDHNTVATSDDSIADFSSGPSAFGRFDPELVAPSVGIISTVPTGSCVNCAPGRYLGLTGTSMAAPHVTGVVALLREKNPSLSPGIIRGLLMHAARSITGSVYDKGTGVVDALTIFEPRIIISVQNENTVGSIVSTDRAELLLIPNRSVSFNLALDATTVQSIGLNYTFNITLDDLVAFDTGAILNASVCAIPLEASILVSSSTTLNISCIFTNTSAVYASTYAGILHLNGTGHNSSVTIPMQYAIPIVITIPFQYTVNVSRQLLHSGSTSGGAYYSTGDVFTYAYYNPKSGNETIRINWTNPTDDIDLYVYNASGNIDVYAGWAAGLPYEYVESNTTTSIKWIRINGYEFATAPLSFTLTVTDNNNRAPNNLVITNQTGGTMLYFLNGTNITILINATDPDNDTLIFSCNDTAYALQDSGPAYARYTRYANNTLIGNHSITCTATDPYGLSISTNATITVTNNSLIITQVTPTPGEYSILKNSSLILNYTAINLEGNALNSSWYVDTELVATNTSIFTFEGANWTVGTHIVTVNITNNHSTASYEWSVAINQTFLSVNYLRKQVILIGIDGAQFAAFNRLYTQGNLTNMMRLIATDGWMGTAQITGHTATETAPGNAELHTGLNETYTTISNNWYVPENTRSIPNGLTTFERLKAYNSSIKTGLVYGKQTLYIPDGILSNAKPEVDFWRNKTTNSYWTNWPYSGACSYPQNVSQAAADFINEYYNESFYLVVYYGVPDCTGHVYGDNSTQYVESLIAVDDAIGMLLDILESANLSGNSTNSIVTQIIVSADHGWNSNTTGHGVRNNDTTILPLLSNNNFLVLASDNHTRAQCDIAPTILDYFGVSEAAYTDIFDNNCESLRYSPPTITVHAPTGTYTELPVPLNISLNEKGSCNYSIDTASVVLLQTTTNISFYESVDDIDSGSHTVMFSCVDRAGNSANISASFTYTPPSRHSSGGGGSGGGGSSITSTMPSINNTVNNTVRNMSIPADTLIRTVIANTSHSFTSAAYVFTNVSKEFTIILARNVTTINETSLTGLQVLFNGTKTVAVTVYTYNDSDSRAISEIITTTNTVFTGVPFAVFAIDHPELSDGEIINASLNFSIPKSLLESYTSNPADVRLYRLQQSAGNSSNAWIELKTTLVYATDTAYYYVAQSPGLSMFIIGTSTKLELPSQSLIPLPKSRITPVFRILNDTNYSRAKNDSVNDSLNTSARKPASMQDFWSTIISVSFTPEQRVYIWIIRIICITGILGISIYYWIHFRSPRCI